MFVHIKSVLSFKPFCEFLSSRNIYNTTNIPHVRNTSPSRHKEDYWIWKHGTFTLETWCVQDLIWFTFIKNPETNQFESQRGILISNTIRTITKMEL